MSNVAPAEEAHSGNAPPVVRQSHVPTSAEIFRSVGILRSQERAQGVGHGIAHRESSRILLAAADVEEATVPAENQGRRLPLLRVGAGQQPRPRAGPLRSFFGRLIMRSLRLSYDMLPEALPARVRHLLQRIRCLAFTGIASLVLTVALQFWVLLHGIVLYFKAPYSDSCAALHHWLLGYVVALATIPCCAPLSIPFVLWWSVTGMQTRSKNPSCQKSSLSIWNFVEEALYCNVAGILLFAFAFCICSLTDHLASRLRNRYGRGPLPEDVIADIPIVSYQDIPAGTECSICLEAGEPTAQWRQLSCRHVFHDGCILPWLRQNRFCPLCRQNPDPTAVC